MSDRDRRLDGGVRLIGQLLLDAQISFVNGPRRFRQLLVALV